jgi:large repetitive protein
VRALAKNNNKKVLMSIGLFIIAFTIVAGLLLATLLSDANVYAQHTSSAIAQIRNTNITQLTSNKPPIASVAESNQTVQEGTENVTLDGNKSYDPDGKITAYSWEQTAGPIVKLNSTKTPVVKFDATCETADAILKFKLTVTDNNGLTSTFTPVNVKIIYAPLPAICKEAIFTPSLPLSFKTGTSYPFKVNFGTKFTSISKVTAMSNYDPINPFGDSDGYFINNFDSKNANTTMTGTPNNTTTIVSSVVDPPITDQFLGGNFTSKYVAKQGTFTLASLKFCIKGVPANIGSKSKNNSYNNISSTLAAAAVTTRLSSNNITSTAYSPLTSFDAACNIMPTTTTAVENATTTVATNTTNKVDTNSSVNNGIQGQSLQPASPSYPYTQPSPSYPYTQPSPSYPYTQPSPSYPYTQPSPSYPYQNQPPIANAGPNQIVNQGAVVILDGTRSYDPDGGSIISYRWQQIGGSQMVGLTGANTATPTFIAPSVAADTILSFQLTVTDSDGGASASSIVNVLVRKNNLNQSPIANAGPNQIVNQGSFVRLDGTGSYDPSGGLIIGYSWVQTAGIPISLTGAGTATPTFVAPSVAADTILAFSLVVTNNNGATSNNPATVYITVKHLLT